MTTAARALVACLALSVSQCSYVDVVTASYASRSDALQSGAIDRGWIPVWMPESAEDIREAHQLDTNRRWGLFNFAPGDGDRIRAALEAEPFPLHGVECEMPARVEWWPVVLRGPLDDNKIKSAALESYRAKTDKLLVVVNWKQGRVYYWSN